MFVDARDAVPDPGFRARVCVVGAGVAGITATLSLADRGVDVLLVESGGFTADAETSDLYAGASGSPTEGADYEFDHHTRSRFLGGGSNCWGGWCRPLEPEDLAVRSWVPHSGWPITREELTGYYDRTHAVLGLGPTEFGSEFWGAALDHPEVRRVHLDEGVARDSFSQFAGVLRLAHEHRDRLATDPHVRVLLHANLTGIDTDTTGRVTGLDLRTLRGNALRVSADEYVLATGAIENARLLLTAREAGSPALRDEHDLVGRYFMDHPRRLLGPVRVRPEHRDNRLYDIRRQDRSPVVAAHGTSVAAGFTLAPEVREREGLLNARACFRSMYAAETTPAVDAVRRLRRLHAHRGGLDADQRAQLATVLRHPLHTGGYVAARVLGRGPLLRGTQLEMMVEPAPDPANRVELSGERDALGVPRVRVTWQPGEAERRTFNRTAELLATELARAGVADLVPVPLGTGWADRIEGTWHHMGTTRMHDAARHGVVDRDARVHGVANLYVAGSSVFPTAGANFPTMTLTALALRLADHLVERTRPAGG